MKKFLILLTFVTSLMGQGTNMLLLASQQGVASTPALIQSWCQGLGSTGGTTTAKSITGANFVWIAVGGDHTYTVSDSQTNTVTALTNVHSGGPDLQNFYITNPTTSGSYTVTVAASGSFQSISVCYMAWSGMVTSSVLDSGTDGGTGVGGMVPCQVPNTTPSSGVKVLLTSNDNQDSSAMSTINLSYTIPLNGQLAYPVTYVGMAIAYLIQTPNGFATQPTWTPASGMNMLNCSIAAFKGM